MVGFLTKEVKKFIDRAENKFDIIIIDAPPLEYTEARALAIVADGVIFCCPEGGISFGEFYENTRKVNELCNGKVLSLLTKSKIQSHSSLVQYQTELAAEENMITDLLILIMCTLVWQL